MTLGIVWLLHINIICFMQWYRIAIAAMLALAVKSARLRSPNYKFVYLKPCVEVLRRDAFI